MPASTHPLWGVRALPNLVPPHLAPLQRVLLLLVLSLLAVRAASAASQCPPLQCHVTQLGILYNHPNLGHLLDVRMDIGERSSAVCGSMCAATSACYIWMYRFDRTGAYCKMWRADQSPCTPGATGDVTYRPSPAREGFHGFGGGCNAASSGMAAAATRSMAVSVSNNDSNLVTATSDGSGYLSDSSEGASGDTVAMSSTTGGFEVTVAVDVAVGPDVTQTDVTDPEVQGQQQQPPHRDTSSLRPDASLDLIPELMGTLSVIHEEGLTKVLQGEAEARLPAQKQSELTVPLVGGFAEGEQLGAEAADAGEVTGGEAVGATDLLDFAGGATAACPALRCNEPRAGFLFDHPSRGHQAVVVTAFSNRPIVCWRLCRRTEGCALWMYEMKTIRGRCKLWKSSQSPCEPADPTNADTAHFQPRRDGKFVIGGNCKGGINSVT